MNGHPLWDRDFGDMNIRMGFGEGASPALHGETIVVVWDHEGQSFITALDKRTGEERWRAERDEMTSWATPLIVEHNGRVQVITSGTNRVRSYDLETGMLLWNGPGVTLNAIPSPVAGNGVVYLTSGFRSSELYAVKLDAAQGNITDTGAMVWSLDKNTPYVPSPLLHANILYFTKSNSGILSAYDAETGQLHYGPERLPGVSIRIRLAGCGQWAHLHSESRGHHIRDCDWDHIRGARRQPARRWLRRLTCPRGRRDLLTRAAVLVLHRCRLTGGVDRR